MSCVLDASALLALLLEKAGQDSVAAALHDGAIMSVVNLAEAGMRHGRQGATDTEIRSLPARLNFTPVVADESLAIDAALIGTRLPHSGLSLGDRFCLALTKRERLPALTADHA